MSLVVFSVIVWAAVLTLTKCQQASQTQQVQPEQPSCTDDERRTVVRNCALSFRFHHRRYLQFLRSQPTCRSEVFDCDRADELVRCLNTQPVASISNRCWAMVPDVITYLLRTVNGVPCTFNDIFKECGATTTRSLLAADKRPQSGTGVRDSFLPMFGGGPMGGFGNLPMLGGGPMGGLGNLPMFGGWPMGGFGNLPMFRNRRRNNSTRQQQGQQGGSNSLRSIWSGFNWRPFVTMWADLGRQGSNANATSTSTNTAQQGSGASTGGGQQSTGGGNNGA